MIETKLLTKYYGNNIGIKDLNFKLNQGKLYGFVGPNGAGKSTTIKVLLGFIFKDSGEAYINNFDIEKDSHEIKEFTSYVPSDVRLYPNLKIKELFNYNKSFYNNTDYESELKRLIEIFDLDLEKKFSELSTGNKKKVSIILAMVSKPKVLIFDEPTSGLDPIIQERFFTELKERVNNGVTVFLSSHNLSELEDYADYVIFINEGRIIKEIDFKEIEKHKIVTISNGNLEYIDESHIISNFDNRISFRFEGDTNELLNLLAKINPDDLIIENEKLDKYFKDVYRGDNL